MSKWKRQWEQILIDLLQKHKIECEKSSFSIDSSLAKTREGEWTKTVQSGQIVEIIPPRRQGEKLKIKAIDANDLPIEIGTISFHNEEVEYKKGIVGQLIEKDLTYSGGNQRSCLEFNQPIILINSNSIPKEVMESKLLRIKLKGEMESQSGCVSGAIVVIIFALALYYILS